MVKEVIRSDIMASLTIINDFISTRSGIFWAFYDKNGTVLGSMGKFQFLKEEFITFSFSVKPLKERIIIPRETNLIGFHFYYAFTRRIGRRAFTEGKRLDFNVIFNVDSRSRIVFLSKEAEKLQEEIR
jgi:hypothetical protein